MSGEETRALKRVRLTFVTLVLLCNLLAVAVFNHRLLEDDLSASSIFFDAVLLIPAVVVLLLRKNVLAVLLYGLIAISFFFPVLYSLLPPGWTWHTGFLNSWFGWPIFMYAFYSASLIAILMLVGWKVAWRGTS